MKTLKQMQAGRYVLACSYPRLTRRDSPAARSGKQAVQDSAQAAMNLKYSYQKCLLTIAANFPCGLFIGLSYDDEHLPQSRAEAKKKMRAFLRTMRAEYSRRGQTLQYLYNTECKHGAGRLHHHMIVNAIPDAVELYESIWGAGNVDIETIDPMALQALATYFTKEAREDKRKVGERAWTPCKGLRRPIVTTSTIPDAFAITPPAGSYILDNPTYRNEYGTGETAFYILPPERRRDN